MILRPPTKVSRIPSRRLKMMLLLNSVNANAAALAKFLLRGAEPRELWNPAKTDVAQEVFSEKSLAKIRAANDAAWAERELERAGKLGARLLTVDDGDYPQELFDLKDAPLVLYWKGGAKKLPDKKKIGVVGTRRMSRYGREVSMRIGAACAKHDIILISGGAWGVDGCSQEACCGGGGETFAVLGTGIDLVYPAANKKLFERIAERGALISEFPLGANGEPWHFPQRNRIVAALSEKVVVVEAPLKSGSMITARLALELGREIWAVPGQIYGANSEGTNRLIYDGAYPYIGEEIFLGACGIDIAASPPEKKGPEGAGISGEEKRIFNFLAENGAMTIDNLSLAVKMSPADLLKNIALLSAKGIVFMSAPGRYSVKGNL